MWGQHIYHVSVGGYLIYSILMPFPNPFGTLVIVDIPWTRGDSGYFILASSGVVPTAAVIAFLEVARVNLRWNVLVQPHIK